MTDGQLPRRPTTSRADASISEYDKQFLDAPDAPGGNDTPSAEAAAAALDAPLDLMELDSLLHIIDHAPAQLEEQTLLSDAFLIFSSQHAVRAEAFVTRRGRLVSALSRYELYHATYQSRDRLQEKFRRSSSASRSGGGSCPQE